MTTPNNPYSSEDLAPQPTSSRNSGEDSSSTASTTAKIAAAAHSAVDIAAANLEHAEQALRDARVAAGHKVHDSAMQAKSLSEDTVTGIKAYIDLYPLRSVGIALAAGFMLSAVLKK